MKLLTVQFGVVTAYRLRSFTLYSRRIDKDTQEFYALVDGQKASGICVQPLDTVEPLRNRFGSAVADDLIRYLKYILLHNPCKIYK